MLFSALLAVAGACTCGDEALSVTVQVAPRATTTRCVRVAARPAGGGQEVSSAPIARPPEKGSVTVAVYQGELPDNVSVLARGFDDPACTRLNEESVPNAVAFARGSIPQVTLFLEGAPCVGADAGTPCPGGVCRSDQTCVDAGTEFDCLNGADDDGDGRLDCLDADCLSVACTSADLCLDSPVCLADGGCGGPPKSCDMPPGFCFAPVGTCSASNGTCSYVGDPSRGCDDSNLCTSPDRCLEDGGCGGPAVSCGPPPGQCFGSSTGCDPALGCRYPVLAGNTCNDGNVCTTPDSCLADGGCTGTPVTCGPPPGQCFGPTTGCDPVLGCRYPVLAGNTCNDSNVCTTPDSCLADGGCGGTPITCGPPPGQCFGPTNGCDPVAGCKYPVLEGNGCNDGNACTFGDLCGGDAGCVGTAYSCPSTECSASTCLGNGSCSASVPRTGQPCDGGICSASGTCRPAFSYNPSNFNPEAVADGGIAGSVILSCNAWFNSTDGGRAWCGGATLPVVSVVPQPSGPNAVVLAMDGLNITGTGSLTLVGSRPVILAVYGDATIAGTLSARSTTGQDAGAGADPSQCIAAGNGQIASSSVGSGGGGGGFGVNGGSGGDLTGTGGAIGGGQGQASGNTAIVPLRGGCMGGSGARPNDPGATLGHPGRGGGAVQLSAARGLVITGTVTASGAGGQGGREDSSGLAGEGGNGGGGGGSGGAVLLEGRDVLIQPAARLTASGGGGGEGGTGTASTGTNGNPGADGPSTTSAGGAGGAGAVACAGDGAAGGSAAGGAGNGGDVPYSSGGCAAGGGGGAVGRIRVNGAAGCQVDAGVMSPSPSFGGNCP